jgi:hypothetical protein
MKIFINEDYIYNKHEIDNLNDNRINNNYKYASDKYSRFEKDFDFYIYYV